MDINENLQQINTFTGGINSDSSPMYLKDNQYRFAQNLVLVKTDSESKGELRLVDSIETFITDKDSENATITNLKYITSCREYAILIYEIRVDGYTKWCIGVFTEHSHAITRVFGPCDEALGDTLSCVTRYETEKSIKLYIADGIHQILSINVAKFFTIGNDLQLDSVTPLFTTIDQISNSYNILLSQPQASISSSTGRIIGPKVQYAYILYKENGGKTTMSPLSSTITLYDTSTGHNEGFAVGESSGAAIDIVIDITQDQIADKIRLFRISYRASGQDPNIDIVYDDTYLSNSFTFTDTGGEKRSISFAEFTEYQTLDVKPKIIETKDNYLFAGNVQYSQDEVDAEFADFPMDSISIQPADGNYYTLDLNLNVYDGPYKKTLIPGEIYKYGIIIYDKHGRKTTVKQFDEIEVSKEPGLIIADSWATDINLRYSCTPICLKLDFSNISQDWKNKISKIELVRCQKTITNSKVLDYGIIGSPCVSDNPNYLFLSHYITLDILQNHHPIAVQTVENSYDVATNDNAVNDIFIYACPQHIYDQSFLSKIKSIRNTLELKLDRRYIPSFRKTEIHDQETSDLHFFSDASGGANEGGTDTVIIKEYGFMGTDNHFYAGVPIMDIKENIQDPGANGCWAGCDDSLFCNTDIPSSTTGYPYPSGNGFGCFVHPCIMICRSLTDQYESVANRASASIKNIEETNYISPYDFLNNSSQQNITFKGKTTGYVNIGDYTFCNFSSSRIFNEGDPDTNDVFRKSFGRDPRDGVSHLTPQEWWITSAALQPHVDWWGHKYPDIQSGGKYLVIQTRNRADFGFSDTSTTNPCAINTYIAKLINTTAYQSDDDVYYSTGDIYTPDQFNGFQYSYSGDGYFNIFQFQYLHALEDSTAHPISYPVAYAVPIISRIDLKAVSGQIWPFRNSAQNSEFFQDQPVQMQFYKQTKSAYLYNGAYSMDNIAVPYAYVERSSVDSNKNDNRVLYSAKKENGEGIDSWLTFKTNDFIDVDTRFGQITGLKLFADRLLFWQEHAFGMLSVNERQMSQSSDGTQIVLGKGGVLDRFDYISTLYGLKLEHLNCICNSNSAVYWWDSYRKQILQYASSKNQYSSKYQIHLMQIDKSINSLVNNTLLGEADGESANPSIHYDINNRNVLFSLFNRDSLIYSEDFDVFTSVLDYVFKGNTTIDGKSYFVGEYNKVETYLNKDPLHEDDIIYKYTFYPRVVFYVNKQYQYNKVFDNITYYGDILNNNKDYLFFAYSTPSGQFGVSNGNDITDREMEYRMAIPRQQKPNGDKYEWGGRLRGKYLETTISATGPISDTEPQPNFSLQYVITKFRISYV